MWSLGILIGLPIAVVVILALIVCALLLFRADETEGVVLGWLLTVVVIVVVGILLSPLGYYPYEKEYHYWKPVNGTVAEVSKRIIPSGDGISQRYVVVLEDSPQQYGIDDTRASLLKEGDTVHLSCIREWEYAAESGWACRWGTP